jgi:predicted transcriptional regulator
MQKKLKKNMSPDPNLWREIPQEVKDAALLLGNYFKKQGIDNWTLYDVCSRKSVDNLENQVKNLETWKNKQLNGFID